MRRNQIIFAVVLMLVLASFGAVYQFYFKEKLAQYNRDRQFRIDLETAAKELSTFFSATDPETVIAKWRNEVQPWAETLEARAGYFSDGKWHDHETPPAGRILSVWYGEELDKLRQTLYQKIAEKAPNIYPFPEDILRTLEIKSQGELASDKQEVTQPVVEQQLAKFSFASHVIDLLLDEKIVGLTDITLWPRRQDRNHKGQLLLQTVGIEMDLYMKNLVHLLETLKRQKRYFHVDAIHLSNAYISQQTEPVMHVKMLLTQAEFAGAPQAQTGAGSAKSLYDMTTPKANAKPPLPPPAEVGALGGAWKWFKRNILYMNG